MVDRLGASAIMVTGLVGVVVGSALMVLLPVLLRLSGYVGSLALITAGYALFQAATTTAILTTTAPNQRGVTSALFGLARNLGLIAGASAMGAVYAAASAGGFLWIGTGGKVGLQASFSVAVVLAAVALVLATCHRVRRIPKK